MAVIGAMGFSKQLGNYFCACGAKQASGFGQPVSPCHLKFCFTAHFYPRRVQKACEETHKFSPLNHEVCSYL